MKKQRRYFSPEFKAEAVKLVTERGYSVAQACRELSIGETAFRRWLAQIEAETQGYVFLAPSRLRRSNNVSINWKSVFGF